MTSSYIDDRMKEVADLREKYQDHPSLYHLSHNASASEITDMVETWNKIAAYGVPADLIDNMTECGWTAGHDSAMWDVTEDI